MKSCRTESRTRDRSKAPQECSGAIQSAHTLLAIFFNKHTFAITTILPAFCAFPFNLGWLLWQAELTFIHFFQISEIVIPDIWKNILDIQNKYFGYPKYLFWISKINVYFQISEIVISDIRNSYFGYLEFFLDIWNSCASISDITNSFSDIQNNFLAIWKNE